MKIGLYFSIPLKKPQRLCQSGTEVLTFGARNETLYISEYDTLRFSLKLLFRYLWYSWTFLLQIFPACNSVGFPAVSFSYEP